MWSLPISMRSFFFFTFGPKNASPSNGKVLVLTTSECQQIAEWWNGGNTMSYEDWMGFWLTGWAWSKSKECLQKHEDLGANSIQLAMRFRDGKAWGEVIWSHPIRSNSTGAGDNTTWKNISCICCWFWFQGFVGWWMDDGPQFVISWMKGLKVTPIKIIIPIGSYSLLYSSAAVEPTVIRLYSWA